MVRTFSAQAAVAVHNSRLFAIETESRRVAEGLRALAERLVRGGGPPNSLSDVETAVAELFGGMSAVFAIVRFAGGDGAQAQAQANANNAAAGLTNLQVSNLSQPIPVASSKGSNASGLINTVAA